MQMYRWLLFFTFTTSAFPRNALITDIDFVKDLSTKFDDTDIGLYETNRSKRRAVSDTRKRWPQAFVPYEIASSGFSAKERYDIREAMNQFERYTCIVFLERSASDQNYIYIQDGKGCTSDEGMVGRGKQTVNLQSGTCTKRGMILHILGHALGLLDVHNLPNRDEYIEIYMDNVRPGHDQDFEKYSPDEVDMMGLTYDLASIMHYGDKALSIDEKVHTIKAKDPAKEHLLVSVFDKSLAYSDVLLLSKMYNCGSYCPDKDKCGSNGFLDENCQCICSDGSQDCVSTKQGDSEVKCRSNFDDWNCEMKANQGDCDRYPIRMNKYCPKACGKCDCPNKDKCGSNGFLDENCNCICSDGSQDCDSTKQRNAEGECLDKDKCGSNGFLDENCNCICSDGSQDCDSTKRRNVEVKCRSRNKYDDWGCWIRANEGDCDRDPIWMNKNCAKACGKCECEDKNFRCAFWKSQGECVTHGLYMERNCGARCFFCQGRNTITVENNCKNKLSDSYLCDNLALSGGCVYNETFMTMNCAKSCRKCLLQNSSS